MTVNIGDTLNNGATVLQAKTRSGDKGEIVLAFWQKEFVTWFVNDGEAYWGHYFRGGLESAYADYLDRG